MIKRGLNGRVNKVSTKLVTILRSQR